jgi:hypothetical protein
LISVIASRLEPVACVVLGVVVALAKGPDANFDLRNYHWYNAWALLTGRLHDDLLVASLQTYFNPLLDVPYYLLGQHAGLSLATAWAGLLFGLLVALVLRMARTALRAIPSIGTNTVVVGALSIAATLLSVSSVATVSEIGTSMNDINVGVLILAAMLLLLAMAAKGEVTVWRIVAAGVLLGAAAGLKLTTAIYAPALVAAVAVIAPNKRGLQAITVLCLGWAAGLVATHGWWSVLMLQRFESPLPPLYNSLIRSPWFPETPFLDLRFNAKDLWSVLTYPANWALSRSTLVSELPMRDPRMLAGLVSAIALFLVSRARAIWFVAAFALAAYVIWVLQFGILRYAVEIEAVCGILIVALVASLTGRYWRGWASVVAVAVLLAATYIGTSYMDWGRLPLGSEAFVTSAPSAEDDSLIVIDGGPLGIYATFVGGSDLRFVGLNFVTDASRAELAGQQVASMIDSYGKKDRIYVLIGEPESRSQDLRAWKLESIGGSCQPFEGPLLGSEAGRSAELCRARVVQ